MTVVTTQDVVQCPAGEWTQIAEYRTGRKSLLVQCPQLNTASTLLDFALPAEVFTIIAEPRATRKQLVFAIDASVAAATPVVMGPAPVYSFFTFATVGGLCTPQTITIDEDWGDVLRGEWGAECLQADANSDCIVIDTWYECIGVVLGITTNVQTPVSAYGQAPAGFWVQPDPGSGPTVFSLSEGQHSDIVRQAWYAWPVGTGDANGNVYVPVIEAYEPSLWDGRMIEVPRPRLSRGGSLALQDLLRRLQGVSVNGQ